MNQVEIGLSILIRKMLKRDYGLWGVIRAVFDPLHEGTDPKGIAERVGFVVFTLIGIFLFLAAYHHDPSQAKGIDGVLTALLHQPYGPWLLGVVALGLVAFGIYSAMSGLWLRFKRL